MRFSTIFAAPLLVASAVAGPWGPPGGNWGNWPGKNCLADSDVQDIIAGYSYLLINPTGANFNSIASSLLSDKFFVSSDSIDSLAGIPVSSHTLDTKKLLADKFSSSVSMHTQARPRSSGAKLALHQFQFSRPSVTSTRATRSPGDGTPLVSAPTCMRSRE